MLSVDYRLAPEHRFPAGFEDMLAVVKHVAHEGAALGIDAQRLAVGGDSAGGNLALATAVALRDAGASPLKFMLLVYGVYSTDSTTPSWQTLGAPGASLSVAQMDWIWANYLNTPAEKNDVRVAPLLAPMAGLPPAHLIAGDLDPLQDDTRALAAKLAAANVPHTLTMYEGLPHGFIRSSRFSATVRRAVGECAAALRNAFGTQQAQ
jgi:acetyl esterase